MNIRLHIDDGHAATLTFDRPGSSANLFDRATLLELDAHLDALERLAVLRGVVFAGAKDGIFIAGADLHEFMRSPAPADLASIVDLGHRVFERVSRLHAPTVAAIHGACLGGGCELALACDWRVASDSKLTKIGLPETMLGILPAWGGSVRLPRLIGLPAALGLVLTGRSLSASGARKRGLVDETAHPEYLLAAAHSLIARGKRPEPPLRVANLPLARSVIAAKALRSVAAKTRGLYPALPKAVETCTASLGLSVAAGLELEKQAFLELVRTPECRNLLAVFFLQERAKKLPSPPGATAAPVRRTAVIGAGVMGAGIAHWIAARGLPVLLKDVSAEALARGLHTIGTLFGESAAKRAISAVEARDGMDRIIPAHGDVPLGGVDLVIEAAVEKLDAKQAIFRDLESRVRPETVLASNTSALSIDTLSSRLEHPGRVVGLHFFNPVHHMRLVEIIRGPRTSADAVATAVGFVKAIGKLPVVVNDRPGFLVNRVLMPCLVEAVRMVRAGVDPVRIDRVMLDFGMPMGPLRLADEVGLDVARHVAADLASRLPDFAAPDDTLSRLVERGWFGRKSGRGFYVHDDGRRATPNPAIRDLVPIAAGAPAASDEMLRDRLVLPMVNEAARCLDEGVVNSPEDVDFAMVLGTGWAPFRGGPLRFADSLGITEVVARLAILTRDVAPHFTPCDRLRSMTHDNRSFYPALP